MTELSPPNIPLEPSDEYICHHDGPTVTLAKTRSVATGFANLGHDFLASSGCPLPYSC